MVMLRLRDKHGLGRAFRGANLNAGFFDLGLTPSVRNWGSERLVVNTEDLTRFADGYVRDGIDRRRPDVLADLRRPQGPAAGPVHGRHLRSADRRHALHVRPLGGGGQWRAHGDLSGGCHIFVRHPGAMSERALELIDRFLMALA